jgi:hypothetical protein
MKIADAMEREKGATFDSLFKKREDTYRPGQIKESDLDKIVTLDLRLQRD